MQLLIEHTFNFSKVVFIVSSTGLLVVASLTSIWTVIILNGINWEVKLDTVKNEHILQPPWEHILLTAISVFADKTTLTNDTASYKSPDRWDWEVSCESYGHCLEEVKCAPQMPVDML